VNLDSDEYDPPSEAAASESFSFPTWRQSMSDDFVTVCTSQFASEAESVKLLLEQEGIETFIADANLVNTNWFLGPAVGYIKVQVPRSQEAAALEILREHPMATGTPGETDAPAKCLACGAPMAEDAERCAACGWTFETESNADEDGPQDSL
jgi:Putative prokaryotic signal transducing protein